MSMFITTACVCIALLLDRVLGEPTRLHPLVGFGKLANTLEKRLRDNTERAPSLVFAKGTLAWLCAVLPITITFIYLNTWTKHQQFFTTIAINSLGLYFCIGAQSLAEHVLAIQKALLKQNSPEARFQLSRVVSRDTDQLNENQIACAAVETTLENGNDAIFAALFWFVIGGLPAAIAYRLINTLDAMWGYKNQHYFYFGKWAARIDDVVNFIPARLTALSYCIVGHFRSGWRCWQQQGTYWKSPNAGPVMAAGAGALQLKLGGMAVYHGIATERPTLGCGNEASAQSISSTLTLVHKAIVCWVLIIFLMEYLRVL